MNIYEAVGGIWVILTSCLGTALIFGLAGYGLYRLLERGEIGKKFERTAVCELLEGNAPTPVVNELSRYACAVCGRKFATVEVRAEHEEFCEVTK